ncbi:hypothetical protein [Actinacidiphila sp. ITFR-21]|uniref:hypothetical protein n=1 Tax=Actinacidiphila sp. ITFR-21 TaxID=3075199 RepID=UPI00288B068E|nr:hypothetical protein [Streptomyces sp. ITFR-21]WNI19166.1 hypothetical protein RLT57_28925 [Streptomyces sp. ITFR-21]
MAGIEGLGRAFNIVPIAAGAAISMRDCGGITFVCTGADTFTLTVSDAFGGSYATPGNTITHKITNSATNGTAAWVTTSQSASNAVTIASGAVAFFVSGDSLPDGKSYVKVTASGSGLVTAVLHDLNTQRKADNLAIVGA